MAANHLSDQLSALPVYSDLQTRSYSGQPDDYMDVGHHGSLELPSGTISLSFSAARLFGEQAILSKDGHGYENGGHLSVWVKDGTLVVRQQSATETEWLKVPELILTPDKTYHLGLSFGEDGLKVWLDGALVAAEPEFKQGIEANDRSLVIGGSRSWRSSDEEDAHSLFEGKIGNVMIFDQELGESAMLALAEAVDPALDNAARMEAAMEDLLPLLGDLHHGSETLQEMLSEYGVSPHGHLSTMPAMQMGTAGNDTLTGGSEADGINGGLGDDVLTGLAGNDILQGDYGNDSLLGGTGNDILDGGHGEDTLEGGAGDDLLISRADGREGEIYPDRDRDEGDPYNELTNGKLYPDQPIPADDVLIGGSGADIFYFQTLINAKERFIEKHTRDDGSINWHGVAGENDNLHDHWVDVIGANDMVMDFNRSEGDRIVIEGHTTEIASITYGDVNGDGIMDHSVIALYSDQGGGGGAHNDDRLGNITVYGDLVKASDIEHTAKPAYGIVHTIDDLDEALAPKTNGIDAPNPNPPPNLPDTDDVNVPGVAAPVFAIEGNHHFTGEDDDYMDVGHHGSLELPSGTISLSFSAARLFGEQAILSKDGHGYENGGHLSVWVKDGTLVVRQQSATETEWLKVPELILTPDKTYHLGLSFGEDGLKVWLDGALVAAEPEFKQGIEANDRSLVIGGSRSWRSSDEEDAHSLFEGKIGNVMIFDQELGESAMLALAEAVDPALDNAARMEAAMEDLLPLLGDLHHGSETLQEMLSEYGVSPHGHLSTMPAMQMGTAGNDTLTGGSEADGINGGLGDDVLTGLAGNDILQGDYGNDSLLGGTGNDILDGGHGEDTLEGGAGDDLLISRADGREGEIYPDRDRDEGDPYNELTNGKLYPDQPIPADDVLIGGSGADIFYFQTLINAKERFIEKHTRDDGSINWHGVAGENDNLHDHWVDVIGANDMVMDFNRSEGDRIVIEGHTTEIASITYGDVNGDGIMDHSVIALYSDQGGGGGAHNDDRLGNITVYGDLVKASDIEHTAKPAYGIVHTIDDLDEALAPKTNGIDAPNPNPPPNLPDTDDLHINDLPSPVFAVPGSYDFRADGRAPLIFEHTDRLDLVQGAIALNFVASELTDHQVLFSKDASGYVNGGHITAYLNASGTLTVRFQDQDESYYLKAQGLVEAGKAYDLAVTFGEHGVELLLDGARVAYDPDVVFDTSTNSEYLIVGASGWNNSPGQIDRVSSHFNGTISDFVVFNQPLSFQELLDAGFGTGDFGQLGLSDRPGYLVGSFRDDVLIGDGEANTLDGNAGDDSLNGGVGDDELLGELGNDTLVGGVGEDTLVGGAGDDIYGVENAKDQIVELRGEGIDYVEASVSFVLRDHSQHLETLTLTGTADLNGTGNWQNNTIIGNTGNNVLNGAWGNDTLIGGAGNDSFLDDAGADRMIGGAGDDTYWVDDVDDQVVENPNEGTDHVHSSVSFALRDHSQFLETLTLVDKSDINGTGNVQDNTVVGNAGNNVLNGAWGNDTLIGGAGDDSFLDDAGADHMIGGLGNDTYRVDDIGDSIVENPDEGTDHVEASVSFALRQHSQHLESLTLSGTENINGTGNWQHNAITGNAGDNVLNGAWGNDTLIGGAGDDSFLDDKGADHMVGGAGNDTYRVDDTGDSIVENTDEGTDHVEASVSFALRQHSQHLESLTLTGTENIDGTGNWQHNAITGNDGNNRLDGAWGNDTLTGGEGDDIFVFSVGTDVVSDFASGDLIDLSGVEDLNDFNDLGAGHFQEEDGNAVIQDGLGNSLLLTGISMNQLGPDDFLFV